MAYHLINFLVAVVPAVLLVYWTWAANRFRREPGIVVFLFFFYGAFGASLLAWLIQFFTQGMLKAILPEEFARQILIILVAPVSEEITKAFLFLPALLIGSRWILGGMSGGFALGAAIGIGFSMSENFSYFTQSLEGPYRDWQRLLLFRTILTLPMHLIATGFVGAAIGRVRMDRGNASKALFAGLLALAAATLFHGVFNVASQFFMMRESASVPWTIPAFTAILLIGMSIAAIHLLAWKDEREARKTLRRLCDEGALPAQWLPILLRENRRAEKGWFPGTEQEKRRFVQLLMEIVNTPPSGPHQEEYQRLLHEIRGLSGKAE